MAELETLRLRLRLLRETDVDLYFAMLSDPETMAYWSGDPLTERAQAEAEVARLLAQADRAYTWTVELKGTGEGIGRVSLFSFAGLHRRAEIGFMGLRAHWGRGLMGEAVEAVLAYGFGELDLRRIEADVDPDNVASLRLLERRGFAREGRMRQRWQVRGQWRDSLFLARLESDQIP